LIHSPAEQEVNAKSSSHPLIFLSPIFLSNSLPSGPFPLRIWVHQCPSVVNVLVCDFPLCGFLLCALCGWNVSTRPLRSLLPPLSLLPPVSISSPGTIFLSNPLHRTLLFV